MMTEKQSGIVSPMASTSMTPSNFEVSQNMGSLRSIQDSIARNMTQRRALDEKLFLPKSEIKPASYLSSRNQDSKMKAKEISDKLDRKAAKRIKLMRQSTSSFNSQIEGV